MCFHTFSRLLLQRIGFSLNPRPLNSLQPMYGEMKSISCHFVSMEMLMRGGRGKRWGGLLQPPKSEPSVWTIHKTVEINPSWGRFNKSLPVSPSDEHRGRGGGGAQKVGGGTKMWKNNQRHTPIGRHEGKVAFLEHLPLIFIPERRNWFLMRCLLSEVLLILPDSHLWVLRRRQTKRHTNLRLPGVSQ